MRSSRSFPAMFVFVDACFADAPACHGCRSCKLLMDVARAGVLLAPMRGTGIAHACLLHMREFCWRCSHMDVAHAWVELLMRRCMWLMHGCCSCVLLTRVAHALLMLALLTHGCCSCVGRVARARVLLVQDAGCGSCTGVAHARCSRLTRVAHALLMHGCYCMVFAGVARAL